ncbi:hypothetical protein K438DRAFT_1776167 [Mycena galopus ATCC 62051]|nr:hypothetical protein K438DRAFT_1776167 [Mycena galopus ATCC 62051]
MGSTVLGLHVVRGRKSEGVQHISGRRLKSNNPNTDVELNTELELRAGAVVVEEWVRYVRVNQRQMEMFPTHCSNAGAKNSARIGSEDVRDSSSDSGPSVRWRDTQRRASQDGCDQGKPLGSNDAQKAAGRGVQREPQNGLDLTAFTIAAQLGD